MSRRSIPRPPRTATVLALAVACAMVAAACGGSGKKTASTPNPSQDTAATTSTTIATGEAAPGGPATSTTVQAATAGVATTARPAANRRAVTTTTAAKTKQTIGAGVHNVVQGSTTTLAAANVQPGGTFTYLKPTDATTLDPAKLSFNGPTDGIEGAAIFDLLIYYDSQTGAVIPQTAVSLTSTDGLVWTLKIRPNIKFTDGTPYDAAAVRAHIQRIADPATGSSQLAFVAQVQSMDVLDATTLRLTLKAKNGSFPASLVQVSMIPSPTAMQQRGDQFGNNPVGAGPFMLKSWTRGSQMVLVRNPGYWNNPLPYLDQVVVRPILDEQQRTNTLTSGAANMLWTRSPDSEQQAEKGGMAPHPLVTNGGVNIYFNLRKPPFNDARVRQALIYAIDRTTYAKIVNNNLIPPLQSIFSEQSPFFDQGLSQLPYDPAKAQTLFDQAAADSGGRISFTLNAFNVPTQVNQSTYLQGVLNGYRNVKVEVAFYGVGAALTKLAATDFEAFMAGNNFIDPEPLFTSRYVCDAQPSYTGWCDPKFDAAVADAKTTLDPNQRLADFKEAQRLLYAAAPTLYFERNYTWMMSTPTMNNFTYVNDAMVLLDRTWLKTGG